MTPITDNHWTLYYTIGRELAAVVSSGDVVHMPGGCDDLIVRGGRAPRHVNDHGSVIVRDPRGAGSKGLPRAPARWEWSGSAPPADGPSQRHKSRRAAQGTDRRFPRHPTQRLKYATVSNPCR